MKGIEDQPDIRMIGPANDLPGVTMIVDVASPGQRLVADAQPASRRPLAKFVKIRSRAVDASQRNRRNRRAYQHQVGPKLLHDIELALGAIEGAAPLRLRKALEVAEWLEQRDGQPRIPGHLSDFARRSVEGKEIVFENLDAVETRRRNRREFFRQVAGNRHGRNRCFHCGSSRNL